MVGLVSGLVPGIRTRVCHKAPSQSATRREPRPHISTKRIESGSGLPGTPGDPDRIARRDTSTSLPRLKWSHTHRKDFYPPPTHRNNTRCPQFLGRGRGFRPHTEVVPDPMDSNSLSVPLPFSAPLRPAVTPAALIRFTSNEVHYLFCSWAWFNGCCPFLRQ